MIHKATNRLFLALELENQTRSLLDKTIKLLKSTPQGKSVRWLPAKNLHLTIKFLGNVQKTQLLGLKPILTKALSHSPPFRIELATISLFPNYLQPKLVVVDLAYSKPLLDLFTLVENACINAGFASEQKPARPHITLGYLEPKQAPQFNLDLTSTHTGFLVKDLSLYQSHVQPQKPVVHELLERFGF